MDMNMDTEKIIRLGQELQSIMPFSDGIQTNEQYNEAIELMDILVGDAEKNDLLIDYLFPIIEVYEDTAPELHVRKRRIDAWLQT
jgi:HTH-type transcriptional regulator/antitoxin HigA